MIRKASDWFFKDESCFWKSILLAVVVCTVMVAAFLIYIKVVMARSTIRAIEFPVARADEPTKIAMAAKKQNAVVADNETILPGGTTIKILVPTFLGNDQRNFHGIGPVPSRLDVIWKTQLGCGNTYVGRRGRLNWCGSGWTGQPALIEEGGELFLIQSGYDHSIRKVEASSGRVVWRYGFDDVVKSSPSVFINRKAKTDEEKVLIVSGSRQGNDRNLGSATVPSLRGISYVTGKELWRYSQPRTRSYSRDCDGSGLMWDDKIYIATENGMFVVLDPNDLKPFEGKYKTPKVLLTRPLFVPTDSSRHGGNLVSEASVARFGDKLFYSSGSGHIWTLNYLDLTTYWDFFTGSDIDGSTVVDRDGYVYAAIERQYIPGQGGVFKLDPKNKKVIWYFPTGNRRFNSWEGGVIGSVSLDENRRLVTFTAIDGNLYVVSMDELSGNMSKGPNLNASYPVPKMLFKQNVGGAIATPIIVDDKIVSTGYGGIYLFQIRDNPFSIKQIAKHPTGFESTAIVWRGRIYAGSRDGNFYCFGEKEE